MQDLYKRRLFLKFEIKRLLLKSSIKNGGSMYMYRYKASIFKSRVIRFSTIGQQRNRCIFTGRVHNVMQKTQYSRFYFRTDAYHGTLPGCKKATW